MKISKKKSVDIAALCSNLGVKHYTLPTVLPEFDLDELRAIPFPERAKWKGIVDEELLAAKVHLYMLKKDLYKTSWTWAFTSRLPEAVSDKVAAAFSKKARRIKKHVGDLEKARAELENDRKPLLYHYIHERKEEI